MGRKHEVEKKPHDRTDDLTYTLTFEDVVDILEVIDRSEGKELTLEVGDLKLELVKR